MSGQYRATLTPSDHVEGEAETARRQAHFNDDGVIDKHEQKELDRVRKRQLESRGRGPAQVKAYRSAKWMMKVGEMSIIAMLLMSGLGNQRSVAWWEADYEGA